jgi:tartrate dehydratase beta subunit/fumarate hydratase class I family protein
MTQAEGVPAYGRNAVHSYLMKSKPPADLNGAVFYRCGPAMLKEDGEWKVKAASPATSSCEEPCQHHAVREYGAAQYYARSLEKALDVHLGEKLAEMQNA